jgi:hypothetical protein
MRHLALSVALLMLTAAAFQEPAEDKKKQEEAAEVAAKEAVKKFKDAWRKAKKEDDVIDAIVILKDATPHKLIRAELIKVLDNVSLRPNVRIDAAAGLGKYKKDVAACGALHKRAREERNKDALDFRKRCLKSFGEIAPFAKSVDLQEFFGNPDYAVARASIEAVEKIGSVRMLAPLAALLSELERIREDGAPGGPGELPGQKSGATDDSKQERKKELLEPTRSAVKTIWAKVDSAVQLKDSSDAFKVLNERRGDINKARKEEDEKDAKP